MTSATWHPGSTTWDKLCGVGVGGELGLLVVAAVSCAACDVAAVVPAGGPDSGADDGGVDAAADGDLSDVLWPRPAPDIGTVTPCVPPDLSAGRHPVSGSIRGPRVDATLRDENVVTGFEWSALGRPGFIQTFLGANLDGMHDPVAVQVPSDTASTFVSFSVAATAPEVGAHSSVACSHFRFDINLPPLPGAVCTSRYGPCGPDCRPNGELAICEVPHPTIRYSARSGGECSVNGEPAIGDWQLTLNSVCVLEASANHQFVSHGHLTATLVNDADATDTVAVNLTF